MNTELLERGPVQLELSRLLHEAAAGHGRLVFVGGEAGIGKSSLVQRFARVVHRSAWVLAGACDPLSTPRPLGPVLDLQDGLSRRFGDLLTHQPDKDALFSGFLAELSSKERPALVIFEDVHWADEATLDLLRFLGRRMQGVSALLIATYRSDEVGDRHPLRVVLGDLATLPAVRRLVLEPLSLAAVRRLCAGTPLDPVLLHERTDGNPFYVTEVIAAGGSGIPATVRDAVLARAARLPQEAREALDAAAVLGFRIEPWLLDAVARPAAEAIDACLAGGMLRADGERLLFHHELAREALLEVLPPHRRQTLHRSALESLRALPAGAVDYGRLAHHAEGAQDAAGVLEYAPRAARRARELSAHREAAAQFARALRFADRLTPANRAELWTEYSWECAATDQWDEAIRADYELIAIWRAEGNRLKEGWSLSFLVGCLATNGRLAEAEEASRASIEILETLPPGSEQAEACIIRGHVHTLNRNPSEAIAWAARGMELAEAHGDLRVRIMAHRALGMARLIGGDTDGERLMVQALALGHEARIPWAVASSYYHLGTVLAEWYELERAQTYLADGIAYAAEQELEGLRTNMIAAQALVKLYRGRWAEAEEAAGTVRRRGSSNAISQCMALLALGRLNVRRGDPEAQEVLEEALALALPTGMLQFVAQARAARAEAAWLAGDLERVREEAGAALALALDRRHPWFAGELLAWLARSGDTVGLPEWIARPFALQISGAWLEGAAEWRRLGCPYEAALALMECGEPEHLRTALAELEELGAGPATLLAARRLRGAGVRGIPRGPRASTRENPAQLTRREVEIVSLVAEGLQNPQIARRLFLSPKTVGHHVSSVLAKLGVPSRAAAVHEAERLGLLAQDREPETAK